MVRDRFSFAMRLLALPICCAGAGTASLADSPLPPPHDLEVRSPNGQCIARAELRPSRIVVSRLSDGRVETLWTLPGYHRFYAVADGCHMLVVQYPGANLLNIMDDKPGTVVFTFFEDGKEVRKITLGNLYRDLSALKPTTSHWLWLRSAGWSGKNWTVETLDGRKLIFDFHPGQGSERSGG